MSLGDGVIRRFVFAGQFDPQELELAAGSNVTLTPAVVGRRLTITVAATGGAGTMDHAALTSNLAWGTSAHTGTASKIAGFSGAGAAAYYTIGSDIQAYNASLASIAGGTWTGAASITTLGTIGTGVWQGTAVAVLYGGTGATTAPGARTNLGLVIGTDVQAYDAQLTGLAATTPTAGGITVWSAVSTAADLPAPTGYLATALGYHLTAGTTPSWMSRAPMLGLQRSWKVEPTGTTVVATGTTATQVNDGAIAAGSDAAGIYVTQQTSTTGNTLCSTRSLITDIQSRHGILALWHFGTTTTALTTYRHWCCLTTALFPVTNTDAIPGAGIGFRASSVYGANWAVISNDGVTTNTIDTGIAVAASSRHLMILSTPDGTTWTWAIKNYTGSTLATGTTATNVPGTSTALGQFTRTDNVGTAVARNHAFYGMGCTVTGNPLT